MWTKPVLGQKARIIFTGYNGLTMIFHLVKKNNAGERLKKDQEDKTNQRLLRVLDPEGCFRKEKRGGDRRGCS